MWIPCFISVIQSTELVSYYTVDIGLKYILLLLLILKLHLIAITNSKF